MDLAEGSSPSSTEPPSEPPPRLPPPLPARPARIKSLLPNNDENKIYDAEVEGDGDEEISQQMTASYSEISFKSGLSPETELDVPLSLSLDPVPFTDEILQRPVTLSCDKTISDLKPLKPLNLEGTVHVEGNMTHFVTEDLEYKIKISSPVTKKDGLPLSGNSKSSTPNSLYRQLLVPQVGQLDPTFLNDVELEAQRMATSIDNLTENLCQILHSISSITADNVDIYKEAVSKMSDSMDANIKSMYTMMAKTEEVTEAMKGVQVHATRIKEIKRLVDLFESYV